MIYNYQAKVENKEIPYIHTVAVWSMAMSRCDKICICDFVNFRYGKTLVSGAVLWTKEIREINVEHIWSIFKYTGMLLAVWKVDDVLLWYKHFIRI